MTLKDYTDYYTENFIPAYADAVAILADKPEQLVIEQENSLSHIIAFLKDNKDIDNLKKAKGHLERATLDAYKMTYVTLKEKINLYTGVDKNNLGIAFNLPQNEVIDLLKKYDKNVQEARLLEAKNIGKSNDSVIKKYEDSVKIGFKLLDSVDSEKYGSYKSFNIKYIIKNNIFGFFSGIIASLLVWFFTK